MKEVLVALIGVFIIVILLFIICACMIAKEYDDNDKK